jgi:hypothetical protein
MAKLDVIQSLEDSFKVVFKEPSIIGIFLVPMLIAFLVFIIPTAILGVWATFRLLSFESAFLNNTIDVFTLFEILWTIFKAIAVISFFALIASWIAMIGVGGTILKIDATLKRKKMDFNEAMNKGFKNSWRLFIGYFLAETYKLLGFILLIIPGIYFAIKLFLQPAACVLEKNGLGIKKSWRASKGNFWRMFLLALIWIGVSIILSINPIFMIAWLVLLPVLIANLTIVYLKLKRK